MNLFEMMNFLFIFLGVFILTVLLCKKIIPILKSKKIGQTILDIGPRWHKSKEGTPTMGGIIFISASFVVMLGVCIYYLIIDDFYSILPALLTFGLAFFNGLIGIFDDYTKLLKKKNQGITAKEKMLLQLVVAALYLYALRALGLVDETLAIPFTDIALDLGGFYYIFALIFITGMINGANLTDGIDGLLSSVTLVIGAFFLLVSTILSDIGLTVIASVMMGATLGFLMYNFHPARVFMGDTGSLFLGGLVVGCGFMIGNPLLIVLIGIIYIIETLSVIIQVGYFKMTKKRIFKMAPIHHHYEKSGWGEVKIVSVFSIVTILACLISYFAI